MSTRFAMTRTGENFQLTDPDEELRELLYKLVPNGSDGVFTLHKSRNPRFHNLAMSFIREVFNNQDKYDVFEDLLLELKLRCGHYNEHVTLKGVVIYVPKSICFEDMEELEFQQFMSTAARVVLRDFCQDWSQEDLNRIATWI